MIAAVVLRDAGMSVDDRRCVVDPVRRDARGHEAGAVAERAHVETGGDLPHDRVALEALRPLDHFFFGHVDLLTDDRERSRNEWDFPLQSAEKLPVPLIDFLHIEHLAN